MIEGDAPYQAVRMFSTGERKYQFSGSWFCAVVKGGDSMAEGSGAGGSDRSVTNRPIIGLCDVC